MVERASPFAADVAASAREVSIAEVPRGSLWQVACWPETYIEIEGALGSPDEARLTIAKLVEEIAHLNLDIDDALSTEDLLDIYENEMRIAKGEQPRGMPGFYEDESPATDQ